MSATDPFAAITPALFEGKPWAAAPVDPQAWSRAAALLQAGAVEFVSLWGEPTAVHLALRRPADAAGAVLSLACPDKRYPAISPSCPPALRLERALRDLFGIEPEGLPDPRPWLDHGRWGIAEPRGAARPSAGPVAYPFLPAEGPGLNQIPVGPVHAGIIEPGHFRFTANGETVVRLEERFGYAHKGTEALIEGRSLGDAARLAGCVSGDSTVAYAYAFARAVEAALATTVPPRALWLRALMAEIERIANHLGDVGAICNDASFALMQAHCSILRERVLRASAAAFGHRLMMDRIVPGGVAVDLAAEGRAAIVATVAAIRAQLPQLTELYENTTSLQDRTVAAGRLTPELARAYAAGGYVGRASGRGFDARRACPYPPYDRLAFTVPVREEGDVDARVLVRIGEIEASLGLIDQLLGGVPDGALAAAPEPAGEVREGIASVEGFRGDIFVWVRVAAEGHLARGHFRDPSWLQWPLLEAAIEGNIVADFPLCNKSFNCSYSGHDL